MEGDGALCGQLCHNVRRIRGVAIFGGRGYFAAFGSLGPMRVAMMASRKAPIEPIEPHRGWPAAVSTPAYPTIHAGPTVPATPAKRPQANDSNVQRKSHPKQYVVWVPAIGYFYHIHIRS